MTQVCVFPRTIPGNPSIGILSAACQRAGVRYTDYDWLLAVLKPMNVLHIHWPDAVLMGTSLPRAILKMALFCLSVLICGWRRKPILYSVHNIGSNDGRFPGLEKRLWRFFLPRVAAFHHLNSDSVTQLIKRWPQLASAQHIVIPHPNYRSILPRPVGRAVARSSLDLPQDRTILLNFGRLRPYKGVEDLIRVFKTYTDPDAVLVIAGEPIDADYGRELAALCAGEPRIRLMAQFVADAELARLIEASDAVILAHRKINNSGVAYVALSANRVLLAPSRGGMLDLGHDPGPDWVLLYDGDLNGQDIVRAVDHVRTLPVDAAPDLSSSDADQVGRRLAAVYADLANRSGGRHQMSNG